MPISGGGGWYITDERVFFMVLKESERYENDWGYPSFIGFNLILIFTTIFITRFKLKLIN